MPFSAIEMNHSFTIETSSTSSKGTNLILTRAYVCAHAQIHAFCFVQLNLETKEPIFFLYSGFAVISPYASRKALSRHFSLKEKKKTNVYGK
jgi:hypothetical protein